MTAGPFIMTNLEGLFSPFRDLEAEMDELRTMRRVSQIWHEMEKREQGAWMMFGRFFNRQMDEVNELTSPSWDTGLFSPPHIHRFNHSFGGRDNSLDKEENNVIVEFPDDKEIKIMLEEPSVVITEVEDSPEPPTNESPHSGMSRNSSPIRKSSLVGHEDGTKVFTENEEIPSVHITSENKEKLDQAVHSVDTNIKSEKIEKRLKKVDFSKMEVHFEPGSGKVNIVETNEKPPSNQLFRRKRRHRSIRSESPKLHFIGSSENGSYENTSIDTYENRHETSNINANVQFTRLQRNLDLSIFNLRNTLFKNSYHDYNTPKSKDDNIYKDAKINNITKDNKLSDKNVPSNYASARSFNVSSKLQDMIQNSVKNQMRVGKTQAIGLKEINVDKSEKLENFEDKCEKVNHKFRAANSPITTLKKNNSLKRNNSKGKDLGITVNNYSSLGQRNCSKQLSNDDKSANKVKAVNRNDSFKKNTRVVRQESLKSNSSRGSVNSEHRLCQKKNNLKDSFKKESSNSRINRAPSIGKITTNSLKKGGIYVDGRPKKTKGATVTVISYSSNSQFPKLDDSPEKNNVMINNQYNLRNRFDRKDSLKSYCSKESLTFSSNKVAQNKRHGSKDSHQEKNVSKFKENSFESTQANYTRSNHSSSEYACLSFNKKKSDNVVISKSPVYRNIPIYREEKLESVPTIPLRTRKIVSDLTCKNLNEDDVTRKDSSKSGKQFNHQDSSLFQPIKKEKSIHAVNNEVSAIKTPVAIRKKTYVDSKRLSPSKDKLNTDESSKKIEDLNSYEKGGYIKFTKSQSSKLNLTSLRRSKEPLRSFEKISNGWVVGRCNMSAIDRDTRSEPKWSHRPDQITNTQIKITSHINNIADGTKQRTRDSMSPVSQSSHTSRVTEHHQKEAMMRLSKGYPSRKLNSPSTSYLKQNIETRKRSRNVYTPSSVSSQSSNIPVMSKRRPAQYVRTESVRSDTPVPSETVYETLNSRRKIPTASSLVKRNRQSHPCCNI